MTLIELMVVVVSIGILALIAVPRFAGSTEQAFDAVMTADLRNLANAQEAYVSEFKTYGGPTSAGTTPACTARGDDGSAAASAASASAATDNTACTR